MIKRLGIAGCGNVGAGLIMEVAAQDLATEVHVAARDINKAEAAILDAGSSYPQAAANFQTSEQLSGEYEVVVVAAGEMPHQAVSQTELLQRNFDIAINAISNVKAQRVVVIGTPVDRLTEKLSRQPSFKNTQLIGFGGQLDTNRARAIPVYNGEASYEDVTADTTSVLKRISASGKARNLATGKELARLLSALGGEEQVLCISRPDPDFDGLCITWPYLINQSVIKKVQIPSVGLKASKLLDDLIAARRQEALL